VYPVQTCDEVTIAHSVENAPVTCSATSPAGTTSTTVNVSVDATEPALDYEIVGTPDANGWFTGEGVGVVWTASEDISGATLEGCDSVRVTSDGADQTFTCTARSAGGETTITTAPLNYDNTPPVVVPMVEGTKFADTDWYRGDVTVTWDVQDISPTSVCSATTLTDETGGTDVSCTGTSVGGDATETVNLKMDESGPTLTYELSGQLGENAWYVSGVMVDWSATESLSGETLVDCIDVTLSADTGDQGVTESCTAESAGGSASMTTSPFKIDQTAPTVTLGSYATTYDIGDTVVIDCTATDAGSGIATDCVDINQGAWTFGGTGFFSVQFDATDLAGHSATSMTATFEVTVSAAGLQNVVTAMVTDGNLATSLINHLSTAAAAPNENAAAGSLGSFYNQVAAGMNSGAISAEDGAFLQGLPIEMGANVNDNAGGNGKGKGR